MRPAEGFVAPGNRVDFSPSPRGGQDPASQRVAAALLRGKDMRLPGAMQSASGSSRSLGCPCLFPLWVVQGPVTSRAVCFPSLEKGSPV